MSETCPNCRGRGQVPWTAPPGTKAARGSETENCPRCDGEGSVACLKEGEEHVPEEKKLPRERGGFLT